MKNIILKALFLILSLPNVLEAQETNNEKTLPLDQEVLMDSLDNGLTYYIKENDEPNNRAYLYLVLKAGSLQETDEQSGLAHFTEHMAFNGTEHFPKNELIDYLQSAGVRFGADLNAHTGFDQTVYKLPLPTDDNILLESGFKILSDWSSKMLLNEEDIESERGIIIEEERQRGKNVNERLSKQLLPVLLEDSRFLERIPIGKIENIKNFKTSQLRDFYNTWYQPYLQAVVVVGDIETDQAESYIKKYFGEIRSKNLRNYPKDYTIPNNQNSKVKIVTDPEFSYNVVSVVYKHRSKPLKTEADFLQAIKRSAVNAMLGARIREIIQKGNAPFLNASMKYGGYQGGIGGLDAFNIQVVAKDASTIKKAVKAVMQELERAERYGFNVTEWQRVRENFLTSINNTFAEKDKIPSESYVNTYVNHFLKDEPILSIDFTHSFYNEKLNEISVEDLNSIIKEWGSDENQIIFLQASSSNANILPDEETLKEWVNGEFEELNAYTDDVIEGALLEQKLPQSSIRSEKTLDAIGAKEIILENGLKVILKPTDFKNDQILFTGFSAGGTSLANSEYLPAAKIADNIIPASGISKFNATQVQKMLAGKTISIRPFISTYSEGISGASNQEDIEQTLELTYLYLTQPKFDTTVFATFKQNYEVSLKAKTINPIAVFQDTVTKVMQGESSWVKPLTVKELDEADPQQALSFFKDRFDDAGDFTFVFVGNFDIEKITPLIQKYLGALPDSGIKESYKDVGIGALQGEVEKKLYKGLEDKATVVLIYHDLFKYSDLNIKALQATKIILEDKILKRLREKEAGVYSPSIGLSLSRIPKPYYSLSISFSCASSRAESLIAAAKEEIGKIIKSGVSLEDLNKFKAQELRQHELNLRNNNFWLSYIKNSYDYDLDLNRLKQYKKQLNSLTTSEASKKLKEYLTTKNQATLILYPENLDE